MYTSGPILYNFSYMKYLEVVRFMETESRMVVPRGWRESGMAGWCLMDTVSVWIDTTFLEWSTIRPLRCILKNG